MPTISAKLINQRVVRACSDCGHKMHKHEPVVRLYGYAFKGDPKYVVYICIACAAEYNDEKVKKIFIK